jgi:8-oxo-dGTP pyrophosphatase MutT (NUDIX family)
MLALLLLSLWNIDAYEGAGVHLVDNNQVLMVQGARSGKWGFPKGHREEFDIDWLQTANREIKEETGYVKGINYEICDDIPRHWGTRIYWSARVLQHRDIIINRTEHRDVKWIPIEEVGSMKVTRDVEEWYLDGMPVQCS